MSSREKPGGIHAPIIIRFWGIRGDGLTEDGRWSSAAAMFAVCRNSDSPANEHGLSQTQWLVWSGPCLLHCHGAVVVSRTGAAIRETGVLPGGCGGHHQLSPADRTGVSYVRCGRLLSSVTATVRISLARIERRRCHRCGTTGR